MAQTATESIPAPVTMEPVKDRREERRRLFHEADVVVVGAGVLGCAIAVALAKQGRSVILLERSMAQPDRIVGELLQPGGCRALRKLGLGHCLEGIDAIETHGYEVIYYGDGVAIRYPHNASGEASSSASGKVVGWAFHHGRFISKLREACMAEPNISIFETTVTETVTGDNAPTILGVQTETKDPLTGEKKADCFFGGLTIIADGYASKFRKQYNTRTPVVKSKFFALELIDCPLPRANHAQVILGDVPPTLLYQIGTHETRALMDVPENLPSATVANGGVKGHLRNVILPTLPKQIQPSFEKALESGGLRSMPNSFLPPSTQREPGMILLGDAMNMRHPLTGGGMTVAFNDAVLLAELLEPLPNLSDTAKMSRVMRDFHWRRKSLSSAINILAMALYALFAANDRHLAALKNGCFAYFKKGGNCVDGPVGLLAGIISQPTVLVYHFFAVALLSIWVMVKEMIGSLLGLWKLPAALAEGVLVLWKACVVILPYIYSEVQS